MKLAIAAQNGQVFQHFGKCPAFAVYTIENNAVQSSEILDAAGSGHAAMAGLLTKNGIEAVICGGIGGPAKQMLAEAGLRVISGASGDVEAAVQAFLSGTLKDSLVPTCHHHHSASHEHNCHCSNHCE